VRLFGQILASVAAILAGCSTERYEGGFETSDLSARVLTPSGAPAVGARVWLVRSQGITAPAKVLDSTRTDSAGLAVFTVSKSIERSNLGLDGQLGQWLGISPTALLRSDSTRMALAPTESVSIAPESNGETPRLFVPGSHFLSTTSVGGRAVLSLPRGSWTIAKVASSGSSLMSSVVVDSAPIYLDTVPSTPIDTSNKAVLAVGPDIALDSFLVDSATPLYLDRTFAAAVTWNRDSGVVGIAEMMSMFATDDTGRLTLSTGLKTTNRGADTLLLQGGSGVVSPILPDSGCLAIQLRYDFDPALDSGLIRQFLLKDSTDAGASLRLPWANRFFSDSLATAIGAAQFLSRSFPSDSLEPIRSTTWYFSWTPSRITIQTSRGGYHSSFASQRIRFGKLRLHLNVGSLLTPASSRIQILSARLYRPK